MWFEFDPNPLKPLSRRVEELLAELSDANQSVAKLKDTLNQSSESAGKDSKMAAERHQQEMDRYLLEISSLVSDDCPVHVWTIEGQFVHESCMLKDVAYFWPQEGAFKPYPQKHLKAPLQVQNGCQVIMSQLWDSGFT